LYKISTRIKVDTGAYQVYEDGAQSRASSALVGSGWPAPFARPRMPTVTEAVCAECSWAGRVDARGSVPRNASMAAALASRPLEPVTATGAFGFGKSFGALFRFASREVFRERGLQPPFSALSAQQRELLASLPRAESWSRCGRALRPAISVPPAPWGAPRGAEMIGLDSAE
jgi:hypothetical protein